MGAAFEPLRLHLFDDLPRRLLHLLRSPLRVEVGAGVLFLAQGVVKRGRAIESVAIHYGALVVKRSNSVASRAALAWHRFAKIRWLAYTGGSQGASRTTCATGGRQLSIRGDEMMNRREFGLLPVVALAARFVRPGTSTLYDERYRPQFHFTPRKGWTNDPNGLVFYKGEYHLFFQHNPFGVKWGNMTWGHAVSPDLVHWTATGATPLNPTMLGTMFSGSAVVDWGNTAGLQSGAEKTIVSIYTAAGGTSPESKGQPFTQCMAYSNDRGRTWTKYAGNPVVPHIAGENRDPKVVWHAPTRQWIMALFLDGNTYRFLASPNLKNWTHAARYHVSPAPRECPDFFPMPVEGEPGTTKWVWTAANGHYLVGTFDGKRFIPEVMTQPGHYGKNYYAVQTYSDLPERAAGAGGLDGRRASTRACPSTSR